MAVAASKKSLMVLYTGPNDIYSHRTRIVLAEKGVAAEVIEVTKANTPEDFLEVNPYNTLPTLVDRNLVLYESRIIMEYLDERFPHPPLLPVYPVARAKFRLLIHRMESDWYTLVDKIIRGKEKTADKAREELIESFVNVAPVLKEFPYLFSEEFSLIDCCMAPLLWRLPTLGIELPKQAKALDAYAERLFERASFQESLTEVERELRLEYLDD
jgi:RNA polymerase-associated protein